MNKVTKAALRRVVSLSGERASQGGTSEGTALRDGGQGVSAAAGGEPGAVRGFGSDCSGWKISVRA